MAHLSEGTLRRKFDDEAALSDADARHYSACADCQARYEAVADDAQAVAGVLAAPDLKVDVASALNRVRSTPAAQPRFGIRLPIARPASRPMAVFAAAAVMVALVVTAFAAENIFFQPKSLQPVPVNVADLQSLSGLSDYGTFAWTTQPAPQLVTSADQAATVSGLTVPAVGTLPRACPPQSATRRCRRPSACSRSTPPRRRLQRPKQARRCPPCPREWTVPS